VHVWICRFHTGTESLLVLCRLHTTHRTFSYSLAFLRHGVWSSVGHQSWHRSCFLSMFKLRCKRHYRNPATYSWFTTWREHVTKTAPARRRHLVGGGGGAAAHSSSLSAPLQPLSKMKKSLISHLTYIDLERAAVSRPYTRILNTRVVNYSGIFSTRVLEIFYFRLHISISRCGCLLSVDQLFEIDRRAAR